MFSFHKPRVYRSTEGCCICRAKSSSSRFTDSRKYENDSMKCFDLKYPRHGEICNACVLLVKRFKRLPTGSNRHWGHVVDARAGPGTKSLTKSRRCKEDNNSNGNDNNSSDILAVNASATQTHARHTTNSTKSSFIPEKFSKIFKKSKKNKISTAVTTMLKRENGKRNTNAANAAQQVWKETAAALQQSLPTTPESMVSDYEDNAVAARINSPINASTIVQFQTQTRASSYRSRSNTANKTEVTTSIAQRLATNSDVNNSSSRRRTAVARKLGSKRRKSFMPRRNNRTHDDAAQFYDDAEWQERKTCCGMLLECATLPGAVIIDTANYAPCEAYKKAQARKFNSQIVLPTPQTAAVAIMQLMPPTSAAATTTMPPTSAAATTTMPAIAAPAMLQLKPTAMKKHHLFYKRQSESFPQGDIIIGHNNNMHTNLNLNAIKTESINVTTTIPPIATITPLLTQTSSTTTQLSPINLNAAASLIPATITSINNAAAVTAYNNNISVSTTATAMPRHSTAKIATIFPSSAAATLSSSSISTISSALTQPPSNRSHAFLHKIKTAETGKIIKHSLNVAPTAAATTTRHNKQELQNVVKTIENKQFIVSKPSRAIATTATTNVANNSYRQIPPHQHHQQPTTSALQAAALLAGNAIATNSTTKFNDNSSDSGFDENTQERKSTSPLQEDLDRKLLTRAAGGVQTMCLINGARLHAQQTMPMQNNKLDIRKQQSNVVINMQHTQNKQQQQQLVTTPNGVGVASSALKVAQILGSIGNANLSVTGATCSSNDNGNLIAGRSQAKMRAIYNSNTIQHENGVTTIVPASSLAASNQIHQALNAALAPSTVTITPAPTTAAAASQQQQQQHLMKNYNTKKLHSNVVTHLPAAAQHLSNHAAAISQQQHHHQSNAQQQSLAMLNGIMNSNINALNHTITHNNNNNLNNTITSLQQQKVILVKAPLTAAKYNSSSNNNNNINSSNNIYINGVGISAGLVAHAPLLNNSNATSQMIKSNAHASQQQSLCKN